MVCSICFCRVALKPLLPSQGCLRFLNDHGCPVRSPLVLVCFFLQVKFLDVDEGVYRVLVFLFFLTFGELCFLAR